MLLKCTGPQLPKELLMKMYWRQLICKLFANCIYKYMIRVTIIFLLLSFKSFGQIKPGVYNEISDTLFIGKAWIISYSQIKINSDKTFTYNHKTSAGCLLWYDIKGTWFIKSNKLYLTDSAISQSNTYDTITLIRTTVFRLQNNELKYFNSFFDGDKVGYSPIRNISGNFVFKKE